MAGQWLVDYLSWWSYPLLFSASWYSGAALSNAFLVDEISLSLLLIARGMFLSMDGWVIAVSVDVEGSVVRLCVGLVRFFVEIKGDVEEVDNFLICLYGDL